MLASETWRQYGNIYYDSAKDEGLAPCVKKSRLLTALNCYQNAVDTSENTTELTSASKNGGLTSWQLAVSIDPREKKANFYFEKALSFFQTAIRKGGERTASWMESLMESRSRCFREGIQNISDTYEIQERGRRIHSFIGLLDEEYSFLKAEALLGEAKAYFMVAITALQEDDSKLSLTMLHDCHQPLMDASRIGSTWCFITTEARVLQEDVYLHMNVAESLQARERGDSLLHLLIENEEEVNIDMVWEVIDWYKNASILTREKEVEYEAVALSRLGRVYGKVLKMKDNAREYMTRAMQLADSLYPRTFMGKDWFNECSNTLQEYQRQAQEEEEQKKRSEEEPYLQELKKELEELRLNNSDGVAVLLKYVYTTYPPKHRKKKATDLKSIDQSESWSCAEQKKALLNAIVDYHPDKVDAATHGMKWKVLCSELTKTLTARYECFKG